MKRIILSLALLFAFVSCSEAQKKKETPKIYKVQKTDEEWKKILTPMQFYVLRKAGTERAFTSELNKNYSAGVYVCVACKTPLYESKYKYDSGSGWPSFDRAITKAIEFDVDYKIGYARTELKCNTCGGHLGHSFEDGPKETTGIRHCINGAALEFVPEKKQ